MTLLVEALGVAQRKGGQAMHKMIAGDEQLRPDELASVTDPGLFGPASMMWRVHRDPATFIGGLRSLLLQSLHPLAMAGVAQHSGYREDPWGRLNRTGRFVAATTFGNSHTAQRTMEMVQRVHKRVNGMDRTGRPYSAGDPHLLRWVHISQVDSFLDAFNRYGTGKLTDAEQDQYVREMSIVGEGVGAVDLPTTVAGLAACLEGYRHEMEASPEARDAVRFLAFPPALPLIGRGLYGIVFAAAASSLPSYARRMLILPVPPLSESLVVRPAAIALTRGLGWLMAGRDHDL